jgi:hypothetical protein
MQNTRNSQILYQEMEREEKPLRLLLRVKMTMETLKRRKRKRRSDYYLMLR